jgi:serine/threonine protein kinase
MQGRLASRYEVLDKLGEGGMGMVYKARDVRLDRLVALKCITPHLLDRLRPAGGSWTRRARSRPSTTRTSKPCTT